MLDINIDSLLKNLREVGYILIPNFLSPLEVEAARKEYFQIMELSTANPQGKKFLPSNLKNAPWRKLTIGSRSGSGEPYSQVLQTTYISQSDKNYPSLNSAFNEMVRIRNHVTGMRSDYGDSLRNDLFWNACRVHHYPCGGGHMAAHRDTLFPPILCQFEFPFIQILTNISTRGKDFNNGGGYVLDRAGNKFFYENTGETGALLLFDGSVVHGVEDVDSQELFDLQSTKGRISLVASLYSNTERQII